MTRAMKTYSLTWQEVNDTPLSAFWVMLANISRLEAEEDLRHLIIASAAQGDGESQKRLCENLRQQIGIIFIEDSKSVHQKGMARLKELSNSFARKTP